MIFTFLEFLKLNNIQYRFLNGYESIFNDTSNFNDNDILLTKKDFNNIDLLIKTYCNNYKFKIVQIFHQGRFSKNFFIYNEENNFILNLDLYAEISRRNVNILDLDKIFNTKSYYKNIPILRSHDEFIYYLIKLLKRFRKPPANH